MCHLQRIGREDVAARYLLPEDLDIRDIDVPERHQLERARLDLGVRRGGGMWSRVGWREVIWCMRLFSRMYAVCRNASPWWFRPSSSNALQEAVLDRVQAVGLLAGLQCTQGRVELSQLGVGHACIQQ